MLASILSATARTGPAGRLVALKLKERMGIPGESQDRLLLRNAAGQTQSVTKWSADKAPEIDAVKMALYALVEKTKALQPEYEGKFQPDWKYTAP